MIFFVFLAISLLHKENLNFTGTTSCLDVMALAAKFVLKLFCPEVGKNIPDSMREYNKLISCGRTVTGNSWNYSSFQVRKK